MNTVIEICPLCDKEVEIPAIKFTPQICPECGGSILPCRMCHGNYELCKTCGIGE